MLLVVLTHLLRHLNRQKYADPDRIRGDTEFKNRDLKAQRTCEIKFILLFKKLS